MPNTQELIAAIARTHGLIDEMQEDGISKYAIFAALGQALAEMARGMNTTPGGRGAMADMVADTIRGPRS